MAPRPAADLRSASRLRALARFARSMAGAHSVEDVIRIAAREAQRDLLAAMASISEWERAGGRLQVRANYGRLAAGEAAFPHNESYPVSDFPAVLLSEDDLGPWIQVADDEHGDPKRVEMLRRRGRHCALIAPIVFDGRAWGELYAARTAEQPEFDSEDVDFAAALSAQIASGLEKAGHMRQIEQLAYTDQLTALANRRAFDERMDKAIDRHAADGTVVSLIVCDVNGLKRMNDGHGHDHGDALLVHLAGVISAAAARLPGALPARLGGDEFCVLIEGYGADDAVRLAEDLCNAALRVRGGEGVSCGVASTGDRIGDVTTRDRLFRLADAAQYRAKRSRSLHPVVAGRPQPPDAAALAFGGQAVDPRLEPGVPELPAAPAEPPGRLPERRVFRSRSEIKIEILLGETLNALETFAARAAAGSPKQLGGAKPTMLPPGALAANALPASAHPGAAPAPGAWPGSESASGPSAENALTALAPHAAAPAGHAPAAHAATGHPPAAHAAAAHASPAHAATGHGPAHAPTHAPAAHAAASHAAPGHAAPGHLASGHAAASHASPAHAATGYSLAGDTRGEAPPGPSFGASGSSIVADFGPGAGPVTAFSPGGMASHALDAAVGVSTGVETGSAADRTVVSAPPTPFGLSAPHAQAPSRGVLSEAELTMSAVAAASVAVAAAKAGTAELARASGRVEIVVDAVARGLDAASWYALRRAPMAGEPAIVRHSVYRTPADPLADPEADPLAGSEIFPARGLSFDPTALAGLTPAQLHAGAWIELEFRDRRPAVGADGAPTEAEAELSRLAGAGYTGVLALGLTAPDGSAWIAAILLDSISKLPNPAIPLLKALLATALLG